MQIRCPKYAMLSALPSPSHPLPHDRCTTLYVGVDKSKLGSLSKRTKMISPTLYELASWHVWLVWFRTVGEH